VAIPFRTQPLPAPARASAAFTLTELLVVVAIIAILAALAIPVVGRSQATALTTASTQNLRQIHALFIGYLTDNNNVFPSALGSTPDNPSGRYHWRRLIWERAHGAFEGDVATQMQGSDYAKVMWCPLMVRRYGQEQHPWGRGSYAINFYFIDANWRSGDPLRVLNREDLKGKVEPLIMAGTLLSRSPKFGTWEAIQSSRYPYDTAWMNLSYEYGAGRDRALGLFLDGHAEAIPRDRGTQLDPLLRNNQNFE
jgi:prepilin-type N-terminal cleavage/methylation domain-containing protein